MPYERIVQVVKDKYVDVPYNTIKKNIQIVDKFVEVPYFVEHLNVVNKIEEVPIESHLIREVDVRKEVRIPKNTYIKKEITVPVKKTILVEKEKRVEVPIEEVRINFVDKIYYQDKVVIKRVEKEVAIEKIVVKRVENPVQIIKEVLVPKEKIVKKKVERITYKPVEKFNDIVVESITNKLNVTVEDYNVDFVVDIVEMKVQESVTNKEVPIYNTNIIYKKEEVEVEKIVWTDK